MPYVARSKQAKQKLRGASNPELRQHVLTCGHRTDAPPSVSNPARWWCCGAWRRTR